MPHNLLSVTLCFYLFLDIFDTKLGFVLVLELLLVEVLVLVVGVEVVNLVVLF